MTFIAHEHTKREVLQFIEHPAHALEIQGAEGAGKGFVALSLAAELLSLGSASLAENHPYIHVLNVRDNKAGINDVRELQKKLTLSVPGNSNIRRVVIIEHFDDLGHEAQNAMLKTLEEPPQQTVLLLTVNRNDQVLNTIHSRTNHITVRPISVGLAMSTLSEKYAKSEIENAYRISNGDVGLLHALLDDANHPLKQAIGAAKQLLTVSRYDRLARVDVLVKDKEINVAYLLNALYRIMDASKQMLILKQDSPKIRQSYERLKLLQQAIRDLDEGVSAKLVLSRLFFQL
jgi:DNA polymerase III delta prime subunit